MDFEGDPIELEALLVEGLASPELTEAEFWSSVERETNALLREARGPKFLRTTFRDSAGRCYSSVSLLLARRRTGRLGDSFQGMRSLDIANTRVLTTHGTFVSHRQHSRSAILVDSAV